MKTSLLRVRCIGIGARFLRLTDLATKPSLSGGFVFCEASLTQGGAALALGCSIQPRCGNSRLPSRLRTSVSLR